MTFFRKALYRRPAAFFTLKFIAEFVWNNISFTARWVVSKSSQNMDLKLRYSTNNKRFFPLSLWFSLSLHEISASSALDCLQKYCIAFEVVLCEQAVSNESGVLQLTGTTFSDTGSPYQLTIPVQIQRQTLTVSPPRLAVLAWGDFHAHSRFARSTIPEGKWGTTQSLSNSPLLAIPFARVNCPTPKA